MSREKPDEDPGQRTDKKSLEQTETPWKQPVEKEQSPKGAPKPDLEKWQESDTH